MALSELKPCPFCGSENVVLDCTAGSAGENYSYATCQDCEASAHPQAWNTRALLDAARAEQKEDAEPVAWVDDFTLSELGTPTEGSDCRALPLWSAPTGPDGERLNPLFTASPGGEAQTMAGDALSAAISVIGPLAKDRKDHAEVLAKLSQARARVIRMTAISSPTDAPVMSREAVARITDPEAWEEYLLEDGRVDEAVASIFQDAYETSLAKADAILALASLGGGEEFLEFKEGLSDLRSLRHEYDCLNGGGPGWSERNAAAWKRADDLFADEDEAAYQRQQEDAHG